MEQWQSLFQQNITSFEELQKLLPLPTRLSPFPKFPLNIPRRLVHMMKQGDFNDPLFLQFVPLSAELVAYSGFTADPVGDSAAAKTPRLLHKYQKRVLLLLSGACAMHCRYCFRQAYPYEKSSSDFARELEYIEKNKEIEEVILSGGDPLSKSDRFLSQIFEALEKIPHIKLIRFHTRFPIGIPERITTGLLTLFKESTKQVVFVLHTNHKNELGSDLLAAMKQIQETGTPVLTQTVLLRGINDSIEAMEALCMKLISHGLLPYYLHQLDKVQGSAHFEVTKKEGLFIIESLRKKLPGYAVPQYVEELAGEASKSPILYPQSGI